MSRFFDALKEASRSPNAHGDSGQKPYVAPFGNIDQNSETEAPPIDRVPRLEPFQPHVVEAEGSGAFGAARKLLDSLQPQPSEPYVDQAAKWQPAEVVLDPKARVIAHTADAGVLEHYRRLRTKIMQQQATKPFRILLVASPNPQEGKTITVLNLGCVFAMLPNFKVLVVDGDMRRGTIGKSLGIEEHLGLSDVIEGTSSMEQAILKAKDMPLHFLLRGTSKKPPAEILQSARLGRCFREMAERFDLVVVDSPPTNLVTDVQQLAENSEAVVLVARAFSTKRKALEQAAQDLKRFRMIGTVLNGGTRAQLYRRKYNGYY